MSDLVYAEIEELVRNAELRTELEPYTDESMCNICLRHRSLQHENDFLASMLDWEISPADPIAQWFEPELIMPAPEKLDDDQIAHALKYIVGKFYEKQLVLDFADHLSDRELYTLIYSLILPCREKNLRHRNGYVHWDCSCGNVETWLRYYASDEEREQYRICSGEALPPKEVAPFYREMPQGTF
ncbi:MAG: hypothetical protein LBH00_05765 [Planctomycetaceae bacterium]|jgi:hypothetical protein|nr:hypothetical protein [Planctomycetaceae bacterium]